MHWLYIYNMGKRKSGETVHPGSDCQPCARCGTTAESYRHPEKWKEELKQWVVSALEINPKSCLCHKCEQSIRRQWMTRQGDEYGSSTEVSSAKRTKADIHCVVTYFHSETALCSGNVLCSSFSGCRVDAVAACFLSLQPLTRACKALLHINYGDDRDFIPMCKLHYSQVYR